MCLWYNAWSPDFISRRVSFTTKNIFRGQRCFSQRQRVYEKCKQNHAVNQLPTSLSLINLVMWKKKVYSRYIEKDQSFLYRSRRLLWSWAERTARILRFLRVRLWYYHGNIDALDFIYIPIYISFENAKFWYRINEPHRKRKYTAARSGN